METKSTLETRETGKAVLSTTDLPRASRHEHTEATVAFCVPKISCLSCIHHIKDSIRELPGYINSRVDLESRRVVIAYDPGVIEAKHFRWAINAAGYRVEDEVSPAPEPAPPEDREPLKRSRLLGPTAVGLMAAAAVFAFYLGLMTLTADWYYAKYQFERYQVWIIALALGLGLQAWLYTFFRQWVKGAAIKTAGKGLAATAEAGSEHPPETRPALT